MRKNFAGNYRVLLPAILIYIAFSLMLPLLWKNVAGDVSEGTGLGKDTAVMLLSLMSQSVAAALSFFVLKREGLTGGAEVLERSDIEKKGNAVNGSYDGDSSDGEDRMIEAVKERRNVMFAILATYTGAFAAHGIAGTLVSVLGIKSGASYVSSEVPFALLFIFGIIVSPLAEELLFRGLFIRGIMGVSGSTVFTVAGSTVLFAAVHGSATQVIAALLFGVVLALIFLIFRSLLVVILLHAAHNMLVLFYPGAFIYSGASKPVDILVILVALSCCVFMLLRLYQTKGRSKRPD